MEGYALAPRPMVSEIKGESPTMPTQGAGRDRGQGQHTLRTAGRKEEGTEERWCNPTVVITCSYCLIPFYRLRR
jgi:hypothetical protein